MPAVIDDARTYVWKNVAIGGGGFVTGVIFSASVQGLVYARTDVGGAYRKDPGSETWVPLLDHLGQNDWNLQGVESLASDPIEPNRVILAVGTYTKPDVSNAEILRSTDYGKTFARSPLPFKAGANEAGRGNGERLAIDPHANNVVYFGTRRDGLWKSTDYGATWAKLDSFPSVPDDSVKHQQPTGEPSKFNYLAQAVGIVCVVFDPHSGHSGAPTSRLFAAVSTSSTSLFFSDDTGQSWKPVPGQPLGLRPNHAVVSPDGVLYVTYGDEPGPNGMHDGSVWKFEIKTGHWTNITPEKPSAPDHTFGYASIAVDAAHPRTLLVGTWNRSKPHDEIFRSSDAGRSWHKLLENPEWDHSVAPHTKATHHHWLSDVEIDPFDSNHALFTTGYGIWASHNVSEADQGTPTRWAFDARGLEQTVPLALISPPEGFHLLSGLGDIDGFYHEDLDQSPPARFDAPGFKNTEWLDFAEKAPRVIVRSGTTYGDDRVLGAWSEDAGAHFVGFPNEPPPPAEPRPWNATHGTGPVAITADGAVIVWTLWGNPPYLTRDHGRTWQVIPGVPVGVRVTGDREDATLLYGYDANEGALYVSRDAGQSMSVVMQGLPKIQKRRWPAYAEMVGVAGKAGELWVVADRKLLHVIDSGRKLLRVESVEDVTAAGLGKSAVGRDYPTLFIAGKVNGTYGIYRSQDAGATFRRINDDQHQFGSITHITGDPRVFGRLYMATGGRGIIYGEPE